MSAVTRVAVWLLLLVVVLAWFLLLWPSSLGGPTHYILVSGESMEPTLHGGDLLVVRDQRGYSPGDIVAYRVPEGDPAEGRIVVHRIAGASSAGKFTMQGDNKKAPDFWHPSQDDIIGKMWFSIPGGGPWLAFLRQPLTLGLLAAAIAASLVLSGPGNESPEQRAPPSAGSTQQHSPASSRHRLRWPGLNLWLLPVLVATVAAIGAFGERH